MIKINDNFLKLEQSYLFSNIAKKVEAFQKEHPNEKVIKLGIGDVTRPLPEAVISAMKKAADEQGRTETFRGYGPEQGYAFLREKIAEMDYRQKGIQIDLDEIFVSDGAKCDTGNIIDLFAQDNIVAITDPVYPVYRDSNLMSGRENIIYLPTTEENNFCPELPSEVPDMIYLCNPNNPTGTAMKKDEVAKWVTYAKQNKAIILYDSAYEAFIEEEDVPRSIYEIEGAKEVAIEFRSYSKTAGFTGIRCAYAVVPKNLCAYTKEGETVFLNPLWNRRQCTKFNGVSYVVQRAAEAVYTEDGQKEIQKNICYYKENAKRMREGLKEAGFTIFGGVNSPYIWLKVPEGLTSWEFFDELLEKAHVVGTPGVGFGACGEGYFRLTAFNTKENTEEAMKRIIEIYAKH